MSRRILITALAAALTFAPAAKALDVVLDHAKTLSAPDGWTTLIVGNPLIADVRASNPKLLIVTGRSFGTTNVMAIDADGNILMSRTINVVANPNNRLSVYRGRNRQTLSCAPECHPNPTFGDEQGSFDAMTDARLKAIAATQSGASGP